MPRSDRSNCEPSRSTSDTSNSATIRADFEETLHVFDDREERVKDEEARLAARRDELDAREARLNGRLAEIETQQTTLVALRSRLEHFATNSWHKNRALPTNAPEPKRKFARPMSDCDRPRRPASKSRPNGRTTRRAIAFIKSGRR